MIAVALFLVPGLVALALWLRPLDAERSRRVAIGTSLVLVALAGGLVAQTAQGEVPVHAFGNWRPPYGIPFVVDRASALFIAVHAVLLLATLLALRPETHGRAVVERAHPLLLMLSLGLFGAFATGDLFNLFVMFEVVLIASYTLLQVPGTSRSLAAAVPTIIVNLVASIVFIGGLGIVYGLCGSLEMADVAVRMADAPPALRRLAIAMLMTSFATKAALVPLSFWMPATYPTPSAPIAALFAGIMTKLGFYGLLRISPLLRHEPLLADALFWLGATSALLGVLGALSQYEVRRLLSFHSVSQVGYMVAALALLTPEAIAAATFFALHHSLVKSGLYFVADELERANASRDLRAMRAARTSGTLLPLCFGTAAFALAGLPPFSGFFGKLAIFRSMWQEAEFAGLALLVVASIFTLASMLKIWRFAFQRAPQPEGQPQVPRLEMGRAPILLAALVLALSVAAGPAVRFAHDAATQVLDVEGRAAAVASIAGYPTPSAGGGP